MESTTVPSRAANGSHTGLLRRVFGRSSDAEMAAHYAERARIAQDRGEPERSEALLREASKSIGNYAVPSDELYDLHMSIGKLFSRLNNQSALYGAAGEFAIAADISEALGLTRGEPRMFLQAFSTRLMVARVLVEIGETLEASRAYRSAEKMAREHGIGNGFVDYAHAHGKKLVEQLLGREYIRPDMLEPLSTAVDYYHIGNSAVEVHPDIKRFGVQICNELIQRAEESAKVMPATMTRLTQGDYTPSQSDLFWVLSSNLVIAARTLAEAAQIARSLKLETIDVVYLKSRVAELNDEIGRRTREHDDLIRSYS